MAHSAPYDVCQASAIAAWRTRVAGVLTEYIEHVSKVEAHRAHTELNLTFKQGDGEGRQGSKLQACDGSAHREVEFNDLPRMRGGPNRPRVCKLESATWQFQSAT